LGAKLTGPSPVGERAAPERRGETRRRPSRRPAWWRCGREIHKKRASTYGEKEPHPSNPTERTPERLYSATGERGGHPGAPNLRSGPHDAHSTCGCRGRT